MGRRGSGLVTTFAWALVALACTEDPVQTSVDGGPPPLVSECSPSDPCGTGERCVSGRCVITCRSDGDCSARERCRGEGPLAGLCVSRDEPLPVDPCVGTACGGATPVCHPLAGICVACSAGEHCTSDAPVCDRGLGRCVSAAASLCGACEADADCASAGNAGGAAWKCVGFDEPYERVCVPSCAEDEDCPVGFACSPAREACFPVRGSCTSYRAASEARACEGAVACSAVGVTAASVFAGVCHLGTCALGCDQTPDCPGSLLCAAQVCVPPDDGDAGVP